MKENVTKKTIVIKSPLPLYGGGIAALLYALLFPLYSWMHLILFAAVILVVTLGLEKIVPKKTKVIEVKEPPKSTGNPEADRLLYEGRLSLEGIHQANEMIQDPVLTEKLNQMEGLTDKILDRIEEKPEKAAEIRRFSEYYLPTVRKMLENYVEMKKAGTGGKTLETLAKIESAMDRILEGFRKQLDELYENEAFDVSTDIDVIDSLLVREGLVEEKNKERLMGAH